MSETAWRVQVVPRVDGGWLAETWCEEAAMYVHGYGRTRLEALRSMADALEAAQRDPAECRARAMEWTRAMEALAEATRRQRRDRG